METKATAQSGTRQELQQVLKTPKSLPAPQEHSGAGAQRTWDVLLSQALIKNRLVQDDNAPIRAEKKSPA